MSVRYALQSNWHTLFIMHLYLITNTVNGKCYIGITHDYQTRKIDHFRTNSKCPAMKAAVNKYGRSAFTFNILCEGSTEYIQALEIKAIQEYQTHVTQHGYNIALGGTGSRRIDYRVVDSYLGTDTDAALSKTFNIGRKSIERRRKSLGIEVNTAAVKKSQHGGW